MPVDDSTIDLDSLLALPGTAQRVAALEETLNRDAGIRTAVGRWIGDLLPADTLVPDVYANWRSLVQDAISFFAAHLSTPRLSAKIIEQLELPFDTPVESRLLRLMARVPGLQKLGQVLARNRHLDPALQTALSELENNLSDVDPGTVERVIRAELGDSITNYSVELDAHILSEATVSAVVGFTWRDPATGKQDRGVLKVLKPHVPAYFTEDMQVMQDLCDHLSEREDRYEFVVTAAVEAFQEVRELLEHEGNFRREQKTLREAATKYFLGSRVRVPRLIDALCTPRITAMSEERGVKVTAAFPQSPRSRRRIARELVDALILSPLLSPERSVLFHADPHAGNLLYDEASQQLVLLDWALTDRLAPEERRHLMMFTVMLALRDGPGACRHLIALSGEGEVPHAVRTIILAQVQAAIAATPPISLPSVTRAVRLLDDISLRGVSFPASLLMFRKALFTLDGILHELAGPDFDLDIAVLISVASHDPLRSAIYLPLEWTDWVELQISAFFLGMKAPFEMSAASLALLRAWSCNARRAAVDLCHSEA